MKARRKIQTEDNEKNPKCSSRDDLMGWGGTNWVTNLQNVILSGLKKSTSAKMQFITLKKSSLLVFQLKITEGQKGSFIFAAKFYVPN